MTKKELQPMTIYQHNTFNEYLFYTGYYDMGFNCDTCKKVRKTHEFLGYKKLDDLKNDIARNDLGRWSNHYLYGNECVKEFLTHLNKYE